MREMFKGRRLSRSKGVDRDGYEPGEEGARLGGGDHQTGGLGGSGLFVPPPDCEKREMAVMRH